MKRTLGRYAAAVLFVGLALALVSFLIGKVFGESWPPVTLGPLARSLAVGVFHAAYFVPAYSVITSVPRSTRDRVALALTWAFLGLMLAVAPLPDTIRHGLDGLRFDGLRIVVSISAFLLLGVGLGIRMSREEGTSCAHSAPEGS